MAQDGLWDRLVNSKWPDNMPIPTEQEAITGAKRIYRKAMGRPFKGEVRITSGNRYTWVRGRVLYVNPDRPHGHVPGGWPSIVHLMAHYAHHWLNGDDAPHSDKQAYLERDLTDYVLASGFHEGSLRRDAKPPEKPDAVKERYQRILAREKSWQTKLNRAKNALAKVQKERRQYERRHGERLEK